MTAETMTDSSMSETSSFRESDIDEGFVRISKLAVASLLIAVFSTLALITTGLLPACAVAVVAGIVALVRIRGEESLGGAGFAFAAIAIATVTGTWSFTAAQRQAKHLYEVAGDHARTYLQVLSTGNAHEAMELRKIESDRQIAGTQLELLYAGPESEQTLDMKEFLSKPSTKFVLEGKGNADWQFVKGVSITREKTGWRDITVEMLNQNDIPLGPLYVTLRRSKNLLREDEGKPTALWHVVEQFLPGDKQ